MCKNNLCAQNVGGGDTLIWVVSLNEFDINCLVHGGGLRGETEGNYLLLFAIYMLI